MGCPRRRPDWVDRRLRPVVKGAARHERGSQLAMFRGVVRTILVVSLLVFPRLVIAQEPAEQVT